jgi:hypothetical protein
MTKKIPFMTQEAISFISKFATSFAEANNLKSDNDKAISSVLIYEKLRVAVEYQEEHLVLKNAMARILKRKYTLSPNITASRLFSDLISELAWANYVNPELLSEKDIKKIIATIDKYLVLLRYAKTGHFKRHELNRMVLDWLACDLDEILRPNKCQVIIVDYIYSILVKNLDKERQHLGEEDNQIQLKAAIYGFLFKPDYAQIQYWFLKNTNPEWVDCDSEGAKKLALSFDPFYNKLDHAFNHPYRRNYIQFTKRLIPPFIVLYSVLTKRKIDLGGLQENPSLLLDLVMEEYNKKVVEAKNKVWRGTIRALIFILITKISLAFILEIPFDKYTQGSVELVSLITNISLPPLLMLIAGTFVKSPPAKNYKVISDSVVRLLSEDKIDTKKYPLVRSQSSTFVVFNLVYSIVSLFIISGVIWLLTYLNFNIVSIILFFFFVSVVSFFSFRIRNIALELAMKRGRDDAITSVFELLMMPFIRLGKFFSDRIASFNPMILILDFLIEAPLKTIIKIMNSWFRFFNSKKEELDL